MPDVATERNVDLRTFPISVAEYNGLHAIIGELRERERQAQEWVAAIWERPVEEFDQWPAPPAWLLPRRG